MVKYSGKFLFRTDPKVHETLAKYSKKSGKSINELINEFLREKIKEEEKTLKETFEFFDSLHIKPRKKRFKRADAYDI
ncbi:MAG: toxin-antitoxin system HicB family antitoxin [Thermodesulfovibrionia bacterium]|nr:toxin-antitoxin system HicB family antitoxin [Thermodesulfovibrionia bacterium]